MDILDNIAYFDEPLRDNEALQYLLENTGNIISAGGDDNYIINNGAYFTRCIGGDIEYKYTLSELVSTFFNNRNVWFKGKFKKTDILNEIQQSVVDIMEKLNKIALKNEEISFLKKEELYNMLYIHMKAMYYYFNKDYEDVKIELKIDHSEPSENK